MFALFPIDAGLLLPVSAIITILALPALFPVGGCRIVSYASVILSASPPSSKPGAPKHSCLRTLISSLSSKIVRVHLRRSP